MHIMPSSAIMANIVRPVAAADYWFDRGGVVRTFAERVMRALPIRRSRGAGETVADVLRPAHDALAAGHIVILFPEGSRGTAESSEVIQRFKHGVFFLSAEFPDVPVVPVAIAGLGKSMPKGAHIPLPCNVEVCVGDSLCAQQFGDDRVAFVDELQGRVTALRAHVAHAAQFLDDAEEDGADAESTPVIDTGISNKKE